MRVGCKRVQADHLVILFQRKVSLRDYADSLLWNGSRRAEVFLAVMSLPKKYRTVLHLYYYEEYLVKEIAELLNQSSTAVTTSAVPGRKN